jgi:hypothetical protein
VLDVGNGKAEFAGDLVGRDSLREEVQNVLGLSGCLHFPGFVPFPSEVGAASTDAATQEVEANGGQRGAGVVDVVDDGWPGVVLCGETDNLPHDGFG